DVEPLTGSQSQHQPFANQRLDIERLAFFRRKRVLRTEKTGHIVKRAIARRSTRRVGPAAHRTRAEANVVRTAPVREIVSRLGARTRIVRELVVFESARRK